MHTFPVKPELSEGFIAEARYHYVSVVEHLMK